MELYLVNCTKQKLIINLRHSEQVKLVPYVIEIGSQKQVLRNASKEEVSAILDQIRHFKPVDMNEVITGTEINAIGYSIRDVKADKIIEAVESNDSKLDDRSEEIQSEVAIAASNQMNDILSNVGATLKESGTEFEELVPIGKTSNRGKKITVERE